MKAIGLCLTILLSSALVCAQAEAESANYKALESACDDALDRGEWESGEGLCHTAFAASKQLPRKFKSEKLIAYRNFAFSLHRQSKYAEALTVYRDALYFTQTEFPGDRFQLGSSLFFLGRAYQGMASIKGSYIAPALQNFASAARVLERGYFLEKDPKQKIAFKERLLDTLQLQKYIATQRLDQTLFRSAQSKIEKLKKKVY